MDNNYLMHLDSDYLEHHGILGMSWGNKNGPPYPLGSNKSTGKSLKVKFREAQNTYQKKKLADQRAKTKVLQTKQKLAAEKLKDQELKNAAKQAKADAKYAKKTGQKIEATAKVEADNAKREAEEAKRAAEEAKREAKKDTRTTFEKGMDAANKLVKGAAMVVSVDAAIESLTGKSFLSKFTGKTNSKSINIDDIYQKMDSMTNSELNDAINRYNNQEKVKSMRSEKASTKAKEEFVKNTAAFREQEQKNAESRAKFEQQIKEAEARRDRYQAQAKAAKEKATADVKAAKEKANAEAAKAKAATDKAKAEANYYKKEAEKAAKIIKDFNNTKTSSFDKSGAVDVDFKVVNDSSWSTPVSYLALPAPYDN